MKIQLIGYSGSGKSTLAAKLAQHYSIPLCHLDTIQFLPNWQVRDAASFTAILGDFLAKNDNWVIDGNYSAYYQNKRLQEADLIIFMDFPIHLSLFRVIKRYLSFRGKTRASMAAGCPERLDWEFLWWVLYRGRDEKKRAAYQSICQTYAHKVIILRNQSDINRFLTQLP